MSRPTLADQPVDVTQVDGDVIAITAYPAHAPAVTLYVSRTWRHRWVVARTADPLGVITSHPTQAAALRSALLRARRYSRAYSVPRHLAAS